MAAPWPYIIGAALIVVFFVADVVLPRGAIAAIGYCLVPVILGGSRRPRVLLGATIVCTALTAAGFWWEPPGADAWMSVFDRAMVVGVLWLTLFLVMRRAVFMHALVEQREARRAVMGELRRSNADLERFATRVAHDLRGPLGSVGLLSQLLARSRSVEADAEALEFVGLINSELRRMSDFIQSLLTYGRAGARDIEPVNCDCSAVLKTLTQSLAAEIDEHGAKITSDPLPQLRADPVLITELFQNLVENSIKYRSSAPPAIHISATAQADGSWLFSLQDNGIGIRKDDCDRIFVPFCQAGHRDSPTLGVGLGLATCRRIVERHGGRIWVESAIGAGATFQFTLPQAPEPNLPQAHLNLEARL